MIQIWLNAYNIPARPSNNKTAKIMAMMPSFDLCDFKLQIANTQTEIKTGIAGKDIVTPKDTNSVPKLVLSIRSLNENMRTKSKG